MLRPAGNEPVTLQPGEEIEIQVVKVSPAVVRLGLTAGKQFSIMRGELLERQQLKDTVTISEE